MYVLNIGLYYTDAIKINENKFIVILTSDNLYNLIICLFDIYNNDQSLILRYYKLELIQINIKILVNIHAFKYGNLLGVSFYNSNLQYPGYLIFNFPNLLNDNDYIYDTKIEINLFQNSPSFSFPFPRIIFSNNIFEEEIIGIKIVNFPNKSSTGIIIKSVNLNSEISINNELTLNDILAFQPSITGAFPKNNILYFAPIIQELSPFDDESLSDLILYYGVSNYYQPQTYIGNSFRLIYKVECHERCKTCSQLGSDYFYYCIRCVDEFPYNVNNGEKCLDTCENYIFIDENGIKYCIENCDNYIYIENENKKYCIQECNDEQYIFIENENVKYCFNNCNNEQLLYIENENEKYCLNNCNNEQFLYIENENEKYCVDNCDNGHFIYEENNLEKYCFDSCNNDQYLYISNENEKFCLSSCFYNYQELYLDEETKTCHESCSDAINDKIYIYQNKCVLECPENYFPDLNNLCTMIVEQTDELIVNKKENNIFEQFSNSVINSYLKKNSEIEIQKSNNDSIIYYCYSSKTNLNDLININQNLTFLNLKECEKKMIKENFLDQNSELLILGKQSLNIFENSPFNIFDYEIYTRKGEKIKNLSICENTNIELSSPIFNLDSNIFEKAIILYEQGYDIFNLSSNFYYDYCTSAYLNNSDLTINVRKEDILPDNISFCQSGCAYNGVDLENKRFLCLCNSNLSKNYEENNINEEIAQEVEENFFIYIIDMINYQIFLCYKLIFIFDNYLYNFGFYVSFCFILLILILLILYYCVGKKSIRLEYLKNVPNLKEIKKKEIEFNKKYNNKSDFEGNKDNQKFKRNTIRKNSKKTKSYIIKKNNNILKELSNPLKKNTMRETNLNSLRKIKANTMIVKNNIKLNFAIYKESKSNMNGISNDISSNKRKKIVYLKAKTLYEKKLTKKNINFNELTYNEAIQKDIRNILQIFISLFNIKLEIIQIIFYPRKFSHKSLTFSLYLFDLLLDLTINSLLFSDDIISQKYYNNGELKLLTTNILSITSNVISNFILYLTGKLIDYYDILETITQEVKKKKNFYQIFLKLTGFIELKIIIFYLVLFLIGFLCTYYLFIFCSIYKKIQKNLFINYIIGSFWSLGFTIAICLIISMLRKFAIVKKIKRLYIISKFIDDKF